MIIHKLWQNKRFTHLLMKNFLLIAGVFVLLIGLTVLFTYQIAMQSVNEQMRTANQARLETQISKMEEDIRLIRISLLSQADDIDVKAFMKADELFVSQYEQIGQISRALSKLTTSCLMNDHIDYLFAYDQKGNKIISSTYGLTDVARFFDQGWIEHYYTLLEKGTLQPVPRKNPKTGKPMLTIMQQLPLLRKDCRGAIVANISCQQLFGDMAMGLPYIVVGNNGQVMASSEDALHFTSAGETFIPISLQQHAGGHRITYQGKDALVSAAQSTTYGWWIYVVDSLKAFNIHIGHFNRTMMLVCIVGLLFALLFAYLISVRMFLPVKRILNVLQERSDEILLPGGQKFGNEISFLADTMLSTLDRNKVLSQELEKRLELLNQTRLNMLRSQINPHFLYNTLATIHWMALYKYPEDNEISDALCTLSELLRFSVKNPAFVSFEAELEQVRRYMMLQKMCFSDTLEMHMEIDPGISDCALPSMLIQPLVENAIKHGLDKETGQALCLDIRAEKKGNRLQLEVRDNGLGINDDMLAALQRGLAEESRDPRSTIGLMNVRQQLRLLFEHEAELTLEKTVPHGLTVKIIMPYVKISDLKVK